MDITSTATTEPKANPAIPAYAQDPRSKEPWWRTRIVWLIVGGPATVVLASFYTLHLAIGINQRDPVLDTTADHYRHQAPPGMNTPYGMQPGAQTAATTDNTQQPALLARDHVMDNAGPNVGAQTTVPSATHTATQTGVLIRDPDQPKAQDPAER